MHYDYTVLASGSGTSVSYKSRIAQIMESNFGSTTMVSGFCHFFFFKLKAAS